VESVITAADVIEMKKKAAAVTIKDPVILYARNIAEITREEKRFVLGASPRAVLALIKASQARAFMEGRDFVKPDDIKAVAPYVLTHRLTLTSEARIAKENKDDIIAKLIQKAKIPM
jgi:MoxR-like ATPase